MFAASAKRNIAFVGLSANGSWAATVHLPYFKRSSTFNIHALQNSSKSSAALAAQTFSLDGVVAYGDSSETASDRDVDIVAVSVKRPMHKDLLVPAIEAGKDVFCKWPLARNLEEAKGLVELAQRKRVRTMIGLQACQVPAIVKAREIVESGAIGQVMGTNMFGHENSKTSSLLANHRPELQLVDDNDQPIKKSPKTAHDYVTVNARLIESGGLVDITHASGTSMTGKNFYWEITGTKGSLVLESPSGHV